jgi:hypothetical protein
VRGTALDADIALASKGRLAAEDPAPLRTRSVKTPCVCWCPGAGSAGAEDVIPPFLKNISTRIGVFQAKAQSRAICDAMEAHGGRCVRILRAFNGPDGTADGYDEGLLNHEDCCYPNDNGQQLIARRLLETGLAPVR